MCNAMDTYVVLKAAMHLRMEDLARWRAVDIATKKTFDIEGEENPWKCCAHNQFTCEKLFAPFSLYESSQRQLCFKFHSLFQRANYMLSSDPLFVEDIEETTLIERRLREAFSVCSAHRSASGRDAQVLLGSFCLRGTKPTMFHFGGEEMSLTMAGLPPGVLAVKICLDARSFMVSAAYGVERGSKMELCPEALRKQLFLNVGSADSDVTMSIRGVLLVLDGRWRSRSRATSPHESSQHTVNLPVLCVLTLFDVAESEVALASSTQ
eukprot:TRINITY_DN10238_c1_g2_i6.p1 TRINITY_DN10238_c1_g2~~TRINITY_DN10238_c1_g2_i6.p1  ORF type:complete len:266 (-),score=39.01 TRINITY_DN10238_c1_g2_i6:59-856(-)